MYDKYGQFIDGKWQKSVGGETYDVINPATEEIIGTAFHTLRRTPHTPKMANANTGKPLRAPINLLMNSIQVCTGLKML